MTAGQTVVWLQLLVLTLSTSLLPSSRAGLVAWPRLTIISTISTIILATTPETVARVSPEMDNSVKDPSLIKKTKDC